LFGLFPGNRSHGILGLLQHYLPTADVIKKAANCGGLSFSKAASLAASAIAGSLIAAIISFSA
jgi:hypothetical protein